LGEKKKKPHREKMVVSIISELIKGSDYRDLLPTNNVAETAVLCTGETAHDQPKKNT
jgi:hypothetical protein